MKTTPTVLATVREHLAVRYKSELGQTLRDGQAAQDGDPVWRLVQADDLRSPAEPTSEHAAGVLLDAELGLVLFFIPYAEGSDLQAQAIAAAGLQSSLHPLHPPVPPPDEFGPWQVVIHWLAEAAARDSWEAQMVQLRQHTGCSEELAFDAVFYTDGELEAQLAEHGLPRLWFTARHVLAQTSPDEAARWMSADRAVLHELENFSEQFTEPEQRRRAELIQDQLGDVVLTVKAEVPDAPRELNSLEVRDFRNLGQVRLHFGLAPVSCRVVHGPNGTGKTSLFEALCLALYRSSGRYRQFLSREERDVTGNDRRRLYAEKYLAPLGDRQGSPRIGLNGEAPAAPGLVESWEEASRVELESSGNVLAQETSQEFLSLSADELALRVLTGYSEFAERLESFVEQRVEAAAQRRQVFLRGLGLSASITRIDTALASMADQALQRELPPPSPALLTWLDRVAEVPSLADALGTLPSDWRQTADPAERTRLAGKLAGSAEAEAAFVLENWLEHRNQLARQTQELVERLDDRLAPLREHMDETLRELAAWGEWLERRQSQSQSSPSATPAAETDLLQRKLAEAQSAQQKARQAGQVIRQQLDHLDQVTKLMGQGLVAGAPNQCPTCGADHAGHGGVAKVVAQLRDEAAAKREALLHEYRALEARVKAIQGELQARGESACPLSAARRTALQQALTWLLPAAKPVLEAHLQDPVHRNRLLNLLKTFQTRPPLASAANARDEARRMTRALSAQFTEARESFFDQDHWKPVQTAFRKQMTKVVAEHLPATLQRLWVELTMNLTSAPWLLPARPVFEVVLKRGQKRASIRLGQGDQLARYVLNQAEKHLLGLGWFFTRYLLHGRFRGRFLVMDDPAQQLDATSYQELCRLWRLLVRLHAIRQLPLRLVLFLHQEDRALDAARATHGMVNFLGWSHEQQGQMRELELFAPSARASHPDAWFQREEAVA